MPPPVSRGGAIVFPDFALSAIWKPTVRRQRQETKEFIDELRRVADREREDENTDFWMFVLMAGIMGVVGGLLWNFFGRLSCESLMP